MRWFLGGFLACILAGAAMSIQGVMNTRLGGHIGTLETNAFVQCTAAVLSLLVLLFWRTGSFAALGAAPKYCWFGGVLALAITVTVMLGMGKLGPTLAVAVILIAQLSAAAAIDAFGIMGTEKLAFGWGKWAGLALMTGGMLLFKMKGGGEHRSPPPQLVKNLVEFRRRSGERKSNHFLRRHVRLRKYCSACKRACRPPEADGACAAVRPQTPLSKSNTF